MKGFKEILIICKYSVNLTINSHRDYYKSVKEYIEELELLGNEVIEDLDKDVYIKMQKTDTIINIQCYPDTTLGSYSIYHYDLDNAIELMLKALKQ